MPGFTFGLDVVLLVGQLRLGEHQTVDEIHHTLLERLAPLHQSISRREVLFLFEAYTALLRSGTEVAHDQQWRDLARLGDLEHQGNDEAGACSSRGTPTAHFGGHQ